MDQAPYGSTLHIALSLVAFFFFFLILRKLFRGNKKITNIPPSPPTLPILGNLHQLGRLPHQSLAALSKKYGALMFLKLGQIPTLVVSSAEMAKEVMKTHDLIFCNRPQTTAGKYLLYGCQDMAFSQYGEYWRQAKKMCVLELLSAKRVESFQYVRDEEVGLLVEKIRGGYEEEAGVNLRQMFVATTTNIISRCVLGEKFEEENGKSSVGEVSRRILVLIAAFSVGDYFPAFGWVDVVRGFIRELKTTSKVLDGLIDKIIDEHKRKENVGKSDEEKDFVDIMLQLQRDDMFGCHDFNLDRLKAILLDMFVGGSDTTATSLEWAMTELMRKPAAMKKVQDEIRTIVGNKPKIEMEDIEKMEYMHYVIKETLRLHPPAPFLVPRETAGDAELEGYHIPAKTRVLVNVWAIQRDPITWENPNEFVPERFIDNSIDYKGHDFDFIPFGSGRRKCAGISFSICSFELALANVLYWFDWKPFDAFSLDVDEENGLTVCKKIPLHLKPVPVNSRV